ncbi:MAG: ring-cleaving dioxygenase [Caldilineaceae bacterium]|nr:ring-cleaving dioxygenase [Caldilineaceae bacterium]
MQPIQGIHHITAIASDPQANINFYHSVLGQRLVKRTVNFDDPATYHFYFADEVGTPGTVLTFFPWRHMARGVRGNGEVAATAYSVPTAALDYWYSRLDAQGIVVRERKARFGANVIAFDDPDGMEIELIASDERATIQPWLAGPVPAEYALRGFHSATLWVGQAAPTAALLTQQLGYTLVGQEDNRYRYQGASQDVGLYIDLVERPGMPPARLGAGSVHHIAFRTVDDAEQVAYKTLLHKANYGVSPVMDRQYFHSIYFRSPGGVLFEVATDAPGFTYDESVAELGSHLKLPSWLEPERASIEASVVPIQVPQFDAATGEDA